MLIYAKETIYNQKNKNIYHFLAFFHIFAT